MTALSKTSWLLILFLFALPIIFFPWAYLAFELPKVFVLFLFTSLAIYFLLTTGFKFNQLTKIHYCLFIFLAWICISSVLGISFQQSFLGSYFRTQGILTMVCYSLLFLISGVVFEDHHFRKQASLAILLGSTATASLAIIQFILLWFFDNTSQLLYSNRVISTFGQPNFLGAYLVISLPFVWFFLKQSSKKWTILVSLLMIVIVLGIFATLSRSAYVGLIALSLIFGIYHYRLLLIGIIFSIILFAILANLFPNLVYKEWYRFQVDTVSKWTAENRLVIAQKSVKLILERPITGYGLENFSLAFPGVVSNKDLGLKDIVVDSSHNLFLDLAVQIGLVGLGLFLLLLALTFKLGIKRIKTSSVEQKNFIKLAMGSVLAFLVIHQFSPISTAPMVLLYLSLGIINGPLIRHSTLHQNMKFIFKLSGISLVFITILFIFQTIKADMLFRNASAYEVSDIHLAIKLDNDAINIAPWVEFYSIRRNFLLKQLGY